MNLKLRKIYRFLRSGSSNSRDYLSYQKFLAESAHHYQKSYFNLTIDFELGWSRARRGDGAISLEESMARSRRTLAMLPALLELSEQYKLPITFAIVAHLALDDCSEHDKPPQFQPFWIKDDWYSIDPLSNQSLNKDYYATDLIKMIKNSSVSHEIASHSFSHVDLGDSETTREAAQFEIRESHKILERVNPELSTFVFPNNHPAYLPFLKDSGFKVYRGRTNQSIKKDDIGLTQFPLGLWLSPQALSQKDLIELIDIGISRNQLVNFWCHLFEFDSVSQFKSFLEPVFAHIESSQKMGKMKALAMREIIKEVNE